MAFTLTPLPYEKKALEPHISSATLDFHHGKHHQTYVDNLNKLIPGTKYEKMTLEEVVKSSHADKATAIFNNAGQVWNHDFYWKSMKQNGGGKPQGELLKHIESDFGSFDNFVTEFKTKGLGQFGSGWVWLVMDKSKKLKIVTTGNAENPITQDLIPLMVSDVWEHAYYLDYQNKRADYLTTFTEKLVNWDFTEKNYQSK